MVLFRLARAMESQETSYRRVCLVPCPRQRSSRGQALLGASARGEVWAGGQESQKKKVSLMSSGDLGQAVARNRDTANAGAMVLRCCGGLASPTRGEGTLQLRQVLAVLSLAIAVGCSVQQNVGDNLPPAPVPSVREVASQFCIHALDQAEESFTHLAEALRGLQGQVDALLAGDQNAYLRAQARYAEAMAKVQPAAPRKADAEACRDRATPTAGAAIAEITPASCLRSLGYFDSAFGYLLEASFAAQAQHDALRAADANAYVVAKARYAEAFAKIRQLDAPLRADHTDCRAKATP